MKISAKLTLPEIEQGAIRVAFASSDGVMVDDHFGWAKSFFLYDVSTEGWKKSGRILFEAEPGDADGNDDKLISKIAGLTGCHMVYSRAIGGPAAARLTKNRIQPMIARDEDCIERIVEGLALVLKGPAPPWLRKLVRPDDPGRFEAFEDE